MTLYQIRSEVMETSMNNMLCTVMPSLNAIAKISSEILVDYSTSKQIVIVNEKLTIAPK